MSDLKIKRKALARMPNVEDETGDGAERETDLGVDHSPNINIDVDADAGPLPAPPPAYQEEWPLELGQTPDVNGTKSIDTILFRVLVNIC